ncbi:MAG: Mur ligase family protein [Patescibacteria group bacterium]
MQNFERYHEAVSFLEGLSNLPIEGDYMVKRDRLDVYLKKMRRFLARLGNPDKDIKFIHITGTAGKGSVTNMIHEILNILGKNVGSFTSPFVTTSLEKIKVKDLYISPDEFADIVEYLKPHIDEEYQHSPYGRPSYFELFLAIALVYFKRKKCEWVVLEVGCGGRYDATNVIENPIITAITNIDYDHMHILGNTLREIAYDKAGIIKKGSLFFTTEKRKPLLKIFTDVCNESKVPLSAVSIPGDYQMQNIALVRAITEKLDINHKYIEYGINKARLQCRFEVMQQEPLVVLDGAHNRAKIRSTIENLKNLKFRKLHLVIGMADNKDGNSMLEQIIPIADSVAVTRFQIKDRKCAHPKRLFVEVRRYLRKDVPVSLTLDPEIALKRAMARARKNDLVLVTGSFFLVGELRKIWFSEDVILRARKSF